MAPDIDFSTVRQHKLAGKRNYFEWRRYFDRTAKQHDLWEILRRQEEIEDPPVKDDHIVLSRSSQLSQVGLLRIHQIRRVY
ncbi:hypothetical protein ANO14919_108150 [Xylariales sp. No.14919]|nr:hypothetical protein ANO14919_108150 [Xylariales sp. No.14919]